VSTYLTGAVGLVTGVEIWAQVPVHRLRFDEAVQRRVRTALGDPRVTVRVGPEVLGLPPLPVSVRAGLKLPGSDFPVDSRVLPLSEGQTDYEVAVESGTGLAGDRMYVLAWFGYRWRTLNRGNGREPGDERFGHVSLGADLGAATLELGLDVLDGLAPSQDGLGLPASARRLTTVTPKLGWRAGPGRLELSAEIPVSGRNVPRSPGLSVGYLFAW